MNEDDLFRWILLIVMFPDILSRVLRDWASTLERLALSTHKLVLAWRKLIRALGSSVHDRHKSRHSSSSRSGTVGR